ncbi:MAG: hypothetical protein ACR2JP_12080 [Acidimicrobiia bacterium]
MSEQPKRRSDDGGGRRRGKPAGGDGGSRDRSGGPRGSGGGGDRSSSSSDRARRDKASDREPKGTGGTRSGSGTGGVTGGSGRGSGDRSGRGSGRASGRTSAPGATAGAPAEVRRRRDLTGAAANLPNWVIEDLARVTAPQKVAAALEALGEASEALADGAYRRAARHAIRAKDLAPRDATVRETLGIAAYRSGDWQTALTELRSYRRLAGETTHLPVEMDALRALGRHRDVEAAWETLQQRGGKPAVMKEGRVVYASHLIDRGDLDGAWILVEPRSLGGKPFEEDLRVWYVAARVAALRGDTERASAIRSAILTNDAAFPGVDELERLIAKG